MSVIQDGYGFPVLTPPVYQYISTGNINVSIKKEHIPDPGISHVVSMVMKALILSTCIIISV